MNVPYADSIADAMDTETGKAAVLSLLSILEQFDIPVERITINVKVRPISMHASIGKFFGNVYVDVSS